MNRTKEKTRRAIRNRKSSPTTPRWSLRTFDDPVLRQQCKPVQCDEEYLPFIDGMRSALHRSKNGVGLAAPQIGVSKRAIIVWPGRLGRMLVMFNPRITERSEEMVDGIEGCLSYPGVQTNVARHRIVTVEWHEPVSPEAFGVRRGTFHNFTARIIQHEIDHLNGICRVGDAWRQR